MTKDFLSLLTRLNKEGVKFVQRIEISKNIWINIFRLHRPRGSGEIMDSQTQRED